MLRCWLWSVMWQGGLQAVLLHPFFLPSCAMYIPPVLFFFILYLLPFLCLCTYPPSCSCIFDVSSFSDVSFPGRLFLVFLFAGPLLSMDCTKYPFTMACRYSFLFAVKRSYLHIDIQAKIMNCKQNGGESVAHVADPKPALCPQRSTPGVRAWAFDKQCYSVLGKYISTFWFSINKL